MTPWDRPGCHYVLNTYAWPSYVDTLQKAMLLAFHKTGDRRYLDPILAAAGGYDLISEGRRCFEEISIN